MLLECENTDGLGDSFSTLGFQSIFSEDYGVPMDAAPTAVNKSNKIGAKKIKHKSKVPAYSRSHGTALAAEKIMEEGKEDEERSLFEPSMSLQDLLRQRNKKHSYHQSWTPTATDAIPFETPAASSSRGPFVGNRWLEGASRSNSCRRLKYNHQGLADESMTVKELMTCDDIVHQALELSAILPSPVMTRASSFGVLDTPPRVPIRERWEDGNGMAKSCRHLVEHDTALSHSKEAMVNRITSPNSSKSVPHVSGSAASVSHEVPPLSPIVRSKRVLSRDNKASALAAGAAVPSLNGRRFVSYSRSLSRKNVNQNEEQPQKSSSTPASPTTGKQEITRKNSETFDEKNFTYRKSSLSDFFEKSNQEPQQRQQKPAVGTPSSPVELTSKFAKHVSDARKKLVSMGKSLSLHNFENTEDLDSLPRLTPLPSVSTMSVSGNTLSVSSASKSPLPGVRLPTASSRSQVSDIESLPSLATMSTPVKSPAVVRPKWSLSAGIPEISTTPLTPDEKMSEQSEGNHVATLQRKAKPAETKEDEEIAPCQVSQSPEKDEVPVYSTEEIRKEVGSLHMSSLFLAPIQETETKTVASKSASATPGRRQFSRLAATRSVQSCRRLSLVKADFLNGDLKREGLRRDLKKEGSRRDLKKEGSRRDLKKEGSRRRVSSSSKQRSSHRLNTSDHRSSNGRPPLEKQRSSQTCKSSKERPSIEKQKSSRSPRKLSRKQGSSHKLVTRGNEDRTLGNSENNIDFKRRTSQRASTKKERSKRCGMSSSLHNHTARRHSHSKSQQQPRSHSERHSRTASTKCVPLSSCSPDQAKTPASPSLSRRRVMIKSSTGKRDSCSSRSVRSKSSSLQRALELSFSKAEEAERSMSESKMQNWSASFRSRCASLKITSAAECNGRTATKIVW